MTLYEHVAADLTERNSWENTLAVGVEVYRALAKSAPWLRLSQYPDGSEVRILGGIKVIIDPNLKEGEWRLVAPKETNEPQGT